MDQDDPDFDPDLVDQTLTDLSNNIILRGAKVGNQVYTVLPLIRSTVPILTVTSLDPIYNQTKIVGVFEPAIEAAWAAAQRYRVLLIVDRDFDFTMYQTNVRVTSNRRGIFKDVSIFLNKDGQFLPPRKVDILYSPGDYPDTFVDDFLIAAQYEVVVDSMNTADDYNDFPGLIPIVVKPDGAELPLTILTP